MQIDQVDLIIIIVMLLSAAGMAACIAWLVRQFSKRPYCNERREFLVMEDVTKRFSRCPGCEHLEWRRPKDGR